MGCEFGLFCGDNSVVIVWEDGSMSVLLGNSRPSFDYRWFADKLYGQGKIYKE